MSSTLAVEEIMLIWTTVGVAPVITAIDKVNFTVYQVEGAMNVPGFAIESYKATNPSGSSSSGFTPTIINVADGQKKSETAGGFGGGPITMNASILWGAGAVVGKYIVTPGSAVSNFFVTREVNVVKISIETTVGANNNLTFTNNANSPKQSGAGSPTIESANGAAAMTANIQVTKIEGPAVSGKMRGVRFIDIGLIQNAKWTLKHADFDGFTPKKMRFSSLEGSQFYLDALNGSTLPWYRSVNAIPGPGGYYNHGIDPNAGSPVTNVNVSINDTPTLAATDSMTLTIGGVTENVDRFAIRADFELYLSIRTKETILSSNMIYTQRGKSIWYFDGSGTVVGGIWTKSATAGNAGDASFTEIASGDIVPVATGPTNNNVFPTQIWATFNQ